MATPATPIVISKIAQAGVVAYLRQCTDLTTSQWNIRNRLRQIDLSYIREQDFTQENIRARIANTYGDSNRYQNITVPVVLPAVEAAVTYQASVFLTGSPILGVVASPQYEDEAMQLETILDDQSTRGGWVRELLMFFRDGFKYNLSAIEVDWARAVVPAFDTDLNFRGGQEGKLKQLNWEGNILKRIDPYNMFFDTRVSPTEVYKKGEFAGYTELYSRVRLKEFINSLQNKIIENVIPAFASNYAGPMANFSETSRYYTPEINPNALLDTTLRATTDWLQWAGVSIGADSAKTKLEAHNMYEVSTIYGRILPSDFSMRVPARDTPQVWKFIVINHEVVIYAERLTNAHGYIPILFSQPLEDGLDFQTKSLAQNVAPMQSVASALMNSLIASRRRAISDRTLYDPSRVSEKDINSDNPSAKIPVRPKAYGKPLSEAVYPFPFRDDQAQTIFNDMHEVMRFSNIVTGQNQVRQGQFVKGNKTRSEYQDVMNNANGRDQMVSMLLESQLFTPLKEILKINILQFQAAAEVTSRATSSVVKIDPVALRKAVLNFKVSDGLLPTDKLINSDVLQVAMQVIGSSPALSAEYSLGALFSYLMKTQGAHIQDFQKPKEQIAFEQALQQWQQMGMAALDKGVAFNVPQPQPQAFGYNPAAASTQ